ncbi:MAG: hypothetical protein EHM45_21810, partial [Desulfobacteraceae bacterium]
MKPRQTIFIKACLGTILVFVFQNYFAAVSAQNVKMFQKGGISVAYIAGTEQYHGNGQLAFARLSEPVEIQGIRFKDWIAFRESGHVEKGCLARDQKINGYFFKAGSEIGLFISGKPNFGSLLEDTIIQGFSVKGSPRDSFFNEKGGLQSGYLSRDFEFSGYQTKFGKIVLRQDSLFELNTDGGWLSKGVLARDTMIGGTVFPGETALYFSHDSNGPYLRSVYLLKPLTIAGLELGYKSSGGWEIKFHPNGRLEFAVSAKDQRFADIPIPQGALLYFRSNGSLENIDTKQTIVIQQAAVTDLIAFDELNHMLRAKSAKPQKIGGVLYAGEKYYYELNFYNDGRVKQGVVENDQEIQGVQVKNKSVVEFHENGRLAQALLAVPQTVQGITFANSGYIRLMIPGPEAITQKGIAFYASGRVKSGYLARNQKIQEWLFRGGTQEQPDYLSGEESEIEFFENGRVKKGYLAETVRIGRKTYEREGRIEFDDSGRVV